MAEVESTMLKPTNLAEYLNKQKVAVIGYQNRLRDKALAILGGRCANPNCRWMNEDGSIGCKDKRCLQVDHVQGFGGIDRKRWRSNDSLYRFIIQSPDRDKWFQLLCANCNWMKRAVNKECRGSYATPILPPIPAELLKEELVPSISRPQDDLSIVPVKYWIAGQEVWKAPNAKKEPIECPFPKMSEDEIHDSNWLKAYYEGLELLTVK